MTATTQTKISTGCYQIGTHTAEKLEGNVFHNTIWALFDGDQKHIGNFLTLKAAKAAVVKGE